MGFFEKLFGPETPKPIEAPPHGDTDVQKEAERFVRDLEKKGHKAGPISVEDVPPALRPDNKPLRSEMVTPRQRQPRPTWNPAQDVA